MLPESRDRSSSAGQQLGEALRGMIVQARQRVGEPGLRIVQALPAHDIGFRRDMVRRSASRAMPSP
jgi:hypothetical protein